jgi:hypothetical protein
MLVAASEPEKAMPEPKQESIKPIEAEQLSEPSPVNECNSIALPEIQLIIDKLAQELATESRTEFRARLLDLALDELQSIEENGRRTYQRLLITGELSDPQEYWDYTDILTAESARLKIMRQRLQLDEDRANYTLEGGPVSSPSVPSTNPTPTAPTPTPVAPSIAPENENTSSMPHNSDGESPVPIGQPGNTYSFDKQAVIVRSASILVQRGHFDEANSKRFLAWAEGGCKELSPGDRINWLTGRRTLITYIVCAQHATLISLPLVPNKTGFIGPRYEKVIISGFLDYGEIIKPGIDRTITRIEEAMRVFKEVMTSFALDSIQEPRFVDTIFGSIDDYFTHYRKPDFKPYLEQLNNSIMVKSKRESVFSEMVESMLAHFWELAKEFPELVP